MEADPATRSAARNYHFLTSAVAPRPIAWVTTVDPSSGVVNAAPFSWFNTVCADPPTVVLAIQERAPGVPKDTVRNMRATGEFVVNVVPAALAAAMVATSADLPPEVSEVERLGLDTTPSRAVQPPRLSASPVHMECRLAEERLLGREGTPRTCLVLGDIIHLAADDAVLDDRGNVDPKRLTLLARMGGTWYTDTADHRSIPRP